MNKNMHPDQAIGRVNIVITAPAGAIVTPIIARICETGTTAQLTFSGPVIFEQRVQAHLYDTVLPLVTGIMELLGIPPVSFNLSVVNSGATASSDTGLTITGFSSDVPAFMALLSAGLGLPVSQDIVFTGHIASPAGDIAQVLGLPAKAEATVLDPAISTFIYPSLDTDISMKVLKPHEYESVKVAIHSCRGRIRLVEVHNIADLLEKSLTPAAIVSASLASGFFDRRIATRRETQIYWAASFLTQSNPNRFWDALEETLFSKNVDSSHELMTSFAAYHIAAKRYPSRCGEKLNRLILSLSVPFKKIPGLFPLLPMDRYIQLVQFATDKDYEDISQLHNALYQEIPLLTPHAARTNTPKSQPGILDHILDQINPELIETTVTRVYDEARARYVLESITVINHEEFLEILMSFYTHVNRYTNPESGPAQPERLSQEALALFSKAFPGTHEREALAEARQGTHGGMRYVLDVLTEYLKQEAREKHIKAIFKQTIDPLDFQARVSVISELFQREKGRLPDEITSQPPEKYAEDYELIIKAYVESMVKVTDIFKRL